MAVALVGGAAIGALFGVLYDVVKESMGRTVMQYKPLLEDLNFTLDCLRPRIIQELATHNVALGLPNDDIVRLQQQMEEGIKLVGRLSKLSMWNCYGLCSCCKCSKPSYTDRLIQLDRSLRALLEVLRLQEARDMKENLLLNRKIYEKQDELATRQSEILKIAGEILRAQQEAKGVQELSGSSTQTVVVQEQIGGSGVRQAASINGRGAALAAVFEILFSAVLQTKEKTGMFKRILGHLESTLDSVKSLIEEIAEYNKVLHLTEEELESLRVEMEKGVELVRKCSKVSLWASNKKYEYTNKLLGLDESLQRLINILRVQLARDARESLVLVTNIETVTMKIEESGIIQPDQTESQRPLVELPSGNGGESSGSGAKTTSHEQNGENGGQQMALSGGGVGAAALGTALARDARDSLVSVSNIEAEINQIEGSGVVKLQNEQNEAKGSGEVPAAMAKSAVGLNALTVEGTRDVTETLDPEVNIKGGWQKVEESWVAQSKTEHPSRTVGLDAMNMQVGASMEETSVSDVEAGLKRVQGKEVYELDAPCRELKEDVLKDKEDVELDEQVEDHHDRKKRGAESVTGASGEGMAICKADGCAVDLSDAKVHNRRRRVCELHSKAPLVIVSGLKRRFCHKCSRFHDLSEFDDTKQSCRRHLPYIEHDGTGTQLKDVSGDTDTVISQIERSGVVQSQNDQSEIKGSYEVVEAPPPAVGLNVLCVQGTRDSKETLQTSVSNTELGLKQIQGKDVFVSEPPYAEYKETDYVPPSVTVGLDVLLRGLKRFLLDEEVSAVVLTGPQGSGKTTLAKYFCEDEEVKNIFKNNIFFVHVSENPNLSLMVQTLYQQIEPKGFQIPALQDESIALHWLHQFFMETALHPSVLVVDDVWPGSESLLDKFDEFKTPNYKIMVTSRSEFPAFGFPYYLKSLNDEDEMTLSRQSHTDIESLDEFLSWMPPCVTFDDYRLIGHFPDSSAADLGDTSSHVSTASRPMDQFQDSSASTLGDKSYVQENAGTMFPLDNPVKSTQTYMQQKLVFKVSINGEKKKALEALKAVSAFDGVYSIGWDSQNQRLTVVGQELDPMLMVIRLRKVASKAEIISVGPAKEEIKKDRKQTIQKGRKQTRITQLNKKETLQISASNLEARLEQIQGKEVLDFEPPFAEYKETEYITSSVTVGLDVLLRGLKRFLLNDEVSAVVLTGPQGSGKTTLAKYFCEDEEVKNIFKNNIFFVHVSENPNLSLMVQTLYQQIEPKGFQILALQDESIALLWLHQFFMETALHPSVLVLDDVWPGSESLLDKFDEFKTPNYKIMVTSRSEFPAFGFPYSLKSLNDEDEMTLSRQSHTDTESLDDEFLSWVSLPSSVTFDDESLIDHFPDSSASDLGGRSSHVSTASRPMDQFQDSSASTLGDKSYVQENAGTMSPLDNPIKSTQTYGKKMVLKVSINNERERKEESPERCFSC